MTNELVMKLGLDSSAFQQGLKDANTQLKTSSAQMKADFGALEEAAKKVGKAMLAIGGSIVAGLAFSAKAAEDERVNIARLEISLKNVGVAYDDVKDSLEAYITSVQRKTGIADSEQRDALGQLVLVTGDYNQALALLPLTLDLAAAKQIDLSTAAQLIGKVAEGNTTMLARYGIVLDDTATASEALAAIQERVAGAAEATASPFNILKASLSDMAESLGAAVLPAMTTFVEKLTNVIDNISIWAENHKTLIKIIGGLAFALVGIGGLLFAIVKVIEIVKGLQLAFVAVRTAMATVLALGGPAGWATLAAGVAIAAGAIWALNELTKETGESLDDTASKFTDFTDLVNQNQAAANNTETSATPAKGEGGSSLTKAQQWVQDRVDAQLVAGYQAPVIAPIIPSFASGGIVPGPVGKPTPIMAHGGEAFLGVGNNMPQSVNISLSFGNYMGDDLSRRNLMRDLSQFFGENTRRTSFGHLNKTYFAGTSSI